MEKQNSSSQLQTQLRQSFEDEMMNWKVLRRFRSILTSEPLLTNWKYYRMNGTVCHGREGVWRVTKNNDYWLVSLFILIENTTMMNRISVAIRVRYNSVLPNPGPVLAHKQLCMEGCKLPCSWSGPCCIKTQTQLLIGNLWNGFRWMYHNLDHLTDFH